MKETIKKFLCELRWLEPDEIDHDTTLISSGLIDSLDLIELVGFLEQNFSITISPGELVAENFESINKIEAFVNKKQRENNE